MHDVVVNNLSMSSANPTSAVDAVLRLASAIQDDPAPILQAGVFVLLLILVDFTLRLGRRVTNTFMRSFTRMLAALIRAQKPQVPPKKPRTRQKPKSKSGSRSHPPQPRPSK